MAERWQSTVAAERAGMRLDAYLAALRPEESRSFYQQRIKSGEVAIDGQTALQARQLLKTGETVTVQLPEPVAAVPAAEPFAYPLLYEDDAIAVIAKPAGVVVHPAPGAPDHTIVNALLSRYPELRAAADAGDTRPGIVHRLDKDTSGCLLIARTSEARFALTKAFAAHEIRKTYLAITCGIPPQQRGRIETLIGRHPVNRQKMAVVERNGKPAVTEFEVVQTGTVGSVPAALLRVQIPTGRTHQIRVHMAHLGCPVAGDATYGGARRIPASRQMLHAWRVVFRHPLTHAELRFTAPVPEDFAALLNELENAGELDA